MELFVTLDYKKLCLNVAIATVSFGVTMKLLQKRNQKPANHLTIFEDGSFQMASDSKTFYGIVIETSEGLDVKEYNLIMRDTEPSLKLAMSQYLNNLPHHYKTRCSQTITQTQLEIMFRESIIQKRKD